jgi:hypothetical protein
MSIENVTIGAAVIGAVAAIIGAALSIAGGFFASYINQRMTSITEKRKIVREKIEETYLLSNQVKIWFQIQLQRICEKDGIEETFANLPFWFLDSSTKEPECPIDRIEMLVGLYIPSLKKYSDYCRNCILKMQNTQEAYNDNDLEDRVNKIIDYYINRYHLERQLHDKIYEQLEKKGLINNDKDHFSDKNSLETYSKYRMLNLINGIERIEAKNLSETEKMREKRKKFVVYIADNFQTYHQGFQYQLEKLV